MVSSRNRSSSSSSKWDLDQGHDDHDFFFAARVKKPRSSHCSRRRPRAESKSDYNEVTNSVFDPLGEKKTFGAQKAREVRLLYGYNYGEEDKLIQREKIDVSPMFSSSPSDDAAKKFGLKTNSCGSRSKSYHPSKRAILQESPVQQKDTTDAFPQIFLHREGQIAEEKKDDAETVKMPTISSVSPSASPYLSKDEADADASYQLTHAINEGLVGMQNLGNTCFMNAALQCLMHTELMVKSFLDGSYRGHLNEKSPMKGQLAHCFASIALSKYQQVRNSAVSEQLVAFKQQLSEFAPQFSGYNQHDSHEFVRFVMDGLSEDLNRERPHMPPDMTNEDIVNLSPEKQGNFWWLRHLGMNSSIVTNAFGGQLMSTITCNFCHHCSHSFDPFYDLSIPLPTNTTGSSGITSGLLRSSIGRCDRHGSNTVNNNDFSLEKCIEAFSKEETLDGENKTYCTKCKRRQHSTKRLAVNRFPRILLLHLKRFGNSRRKKKAVIHCPLKGLDLTSLSSSCDGWGTRSKKPIYDLYAVCNHMGTARGGHYTAACCVQSNRWYSFNDSTVSEIDASTISTSDSPYLLFYKLR